MLLSCWFYCLYFYVSSCIRYSYFMSGLGISRFMLCLWVFLVSCLVLIILVFPGGLVLAFPFYVTHVFCLGSSCFILDSCFIYLLV